MRNDNEIVVTLYNGRLQINGLTILDDIKKTKTLFEDIIKYLESSPEVENGYYLPFKKNGFAQHSFYRKEENGTTNS